jgi:hypothetical protein
MSALILSDMPLDGGCAWRPGELLFCRVFMRQSYSGVRQSDGGSAGVSWLAVVACGLVKLCITLATLVVGVYLFTVALHSIPIPGVTDLPSPLDTDSQFLSLQSLKHIVFESGVASYYAPAPPPPR